MPYTIHLATTESEARDSEPGLSLDYRVHQAIFESPDQPLYDLTLFYNLSDFYQDATFAGSRVISLRGELEEARRRIHTPHATAPLGELCKLCDRAIKKGLNLYGFAE